MPPELAQVAALGLIQGAAELLPVSSSAHVAALPWLLGWSAAEWAPERRKELEVALHAGALAALAPALWRLRPDTRTLALSLAPPVIAGFLLERPIEERLGGPAGLASGLVLGAAALRWRTAGGAERSADGATARRRAGRGGAARRSAGAARPGTPAADAWRSASRRPRRSSRASRGPAPRSPPPARSATRDPRPRGSPSASPAPCSRARRRSRAGAAGMRPTGSWSRPAR